MPRPRDRVLQNLEAIYREAYDRAKAAGDQARMADLDAAYQREQLLLEVLLDIRDALSTAVAPGGGVGPDRRARNHSSHYQTPLRTLSMIRSPAAAVLCLSLLACGGKADLV